MSRSIKYIVLSIKRDWGRTVLIGLGIVALYLFLRLINLTIFPIFADEAIYIRWSQVMRAEATLRFLPLSDGKQPLFMWLTIPFLKLFADPLVGGRMVSVLSGLGSLVGLFLTTYLFLKSRRAALLTILIYTFLPFALFLDRMALVDSLLLTFAIWTFFLASLLVKYQRIDLAILTGIVLGGGLITKSPAMFFVGLIPTTILLLPLKSKNDFMIQISKLVGLWLIVYLFAFVIYNLLRLGPEFHMISTRNKDYVFSFTEVLSHPHDPFLVHLGDIQNWLSNLFTLPILLLSLGGIFVSFLIKKIRITLLLLFWFLIPLTVQLAIAKVFTPRYILFTIFPLIIFLAIFFEFLFEKFRRYRLFIIFLILIVLIMPLSYDYLLLTSPQVAPLPERMRTGYLEEWSSGYGINEVRDYLREVSKEKHINVGTEGYFGTLPDGLLIYFDKDSNVTVFGVGLSLLEVPEPLKESAAAGEAETFLVVNESRMGAEDDPALELVLRIPKAEGKKGQDSLLLYRVK